MRDPWALRPPLYHSAPAYEHTFGPEVAAVCEQVGFGPDPEQKLILDDLFAVVPDPDAPEFMMSAAFEIAVIAVRQTLKTGLMKQAAIGWLFVTQEPVITWSAHEFTTAKSALDDLELIIDNSPMLRKRMPGGRNRGIFTGKNQERIETRDERVCRFKARTDTGSRGLTGDKIIMDEAFQLTPTILGAVMPTLTAVPDPQILYGSSAGMTKSDVLREIRDRGRKGSPGLAYTEYGAPFRPCESEDCQHFKPSHPLHEPGCALDDEDLWWQAAPLLGRSRPNGTGLTLTKMRRFREAEPPAEFARERMGWWDEPGPAELFGAGKWEACAGRKPAGVRVTGLALARSEDMAWSAIVAAGRVGSRVVVRPLIHGPGSDWVPSKAKELQKRFGPRLVVDPKGAGKKLLPELRRAGIAVYETAGSDVLDAYDEFHGLVVDGNLLHGTYEELERSINGATTRYVGDRPTWARRQSTSDISVLEAATLAAWWATRVKSAPPPPAAPTQAPSASSNAEIAEHDLMKIGF